MTPSDQRGPRPVAADVPGPGGRGQPLGHEQAIGDVLEARFGELGCETSRDDIGNLVAVFPGRRAGTILLSTHMDTVGTDTGIKPIIGDDGVIRTDGSTILGADDKSGIAGCLELLTLLGAHPEWSCPTIEFVVTVGEEVGLVGSRHLDVGKLNATHGFVFDTAGAMGSITYWAPTAVDLTRDLHGPQGARGGGAREGHRRGPGRRRGGGRHAVGPHRRGDGRQHRHVHRRRRTQRRRGPRRARRAWPAATTRRSWTPSSTRCGPRAKRRRPGTARASTSSARRSTAPTGSRRTPRPTSRRPRPSALGLEVVPAQVRRRHRRQPLQRQGDPVRRAADGHGRRARAPASTSPSTTWSPPARSWSASSRDRARLHEPAAA